MAQLASLLVPSVQISGPTWADGLFEGLESAGTRINQNRSFGKLADLIEGGGGQQPAQQGGFLSSLMPQRQQQPTGAAPVEAVFRGDPQGSTYQPFINTVRAGGVNNPYALSAIAATGRAESGWSPQNANRTWSDPSQSGQPGTAGGILSWRGDRLNNLARYASGKGEQLGAISPETQAEFFLRENPQLIQQLNNAGSLEEAQGIINNAWRFAGYDQPGGETARRLALARNYYANEFSNMQPNDAAAAIDMIAPGGNGSPLTDSAFDARFGSETTPVVGREALAAQLAQTNEQPVSGYVDPMVSVQPQGQTQQPAAFAPNQVADASGAVGLPPASGLSPDLGGISSKQIADLVRDPNTREIGLRIWQQRQTGSNDSPFHFLSGKDGTLFRANKQTGQIDPVGNFGAAGGGDGEEWGLNPVWGRNEKGETVLGQVSKSGKFKPLDTGDFTPTPGISNIDAGTSVITRNNRTGQVIAETPKDIAGAAAQDEIGTAQGKNIASASGDIQAAQNSIDLIESLRNDPNRGWGTGKSSVFNQIPGSPGFDFQQKVNQATSGAFLTAIQQMRGLGALSNAEGQTATAAVTRMNTASSEQEFLNALSDYEKIVRQGLDRAQSRLQGQQSQQPQAETAPVRATNPQTGETLELRNGQWVRVQ